MISSLYEQFQHWSAKGSVWLYSDTHFDDADCKIMDANWPTPQEQIQMIKQKVHKNDTFILLGDVGNPDYIKQIPGYKVLLCGNHDVGATKYKKIITKKIYDKDIIKSKKELIEIVKNEYPEHNIVSIDESYSFHSPFDRYVVSLTNGLFDEVYAGPLTISDKIILSHEPMNIYCMLNIHGHDHSNWSKDFKTPHINVCSNVIGFQPINLGEIIKSGILNTFYDIHQDAVEKQKIHKTAMDMLKNSSSDARLLDNYYMDRFMRID